MTEDAPRAGGVGAWTVVIPVKQLSTSKSRMDPHRTGAGRSRALAFFLDTASAVLCTDDVARVVVASADPVVAAAAGSLGCECVDDEGHPGINAAAAWAAASAGDGTPAPTAVVVSDLPCLTPAAMAAVLARAPGSGTAFLPDAAGTGTTMWLAAASVPVDCRFGADSAAAHRAEGAVDLAESADPSLAPARRDVDTDDDLGRAVALGVGPHTRALQSSEGGGLLLTVARTRGRAVSVVEESGRIHRLPAAAFAAAGFRQVRPGQRIVLRQGGGISLP